MPDPLCISEEDPINFDGSLDTNSDLQLLHGSDSLADYDQTAHAEHEDLHESTGIVRVKIVDFTSGGTTWTLDATHDPGSGSISWSRGTDHAYYDFGPMTAEQEVDVTGVSDASPPVTKTRRIRIKLSPTDAQPDRPRA
ncbi:hypothetical protein [Enhygromyxa salina]|uniref:Uncharacterized protein n=1 Tax=Enhygromyxa salina TaxID=215803 RepID=A0A2S9XN64_9BACT|nr:hypothetical protein [Enhygromyxa salina]PRP94308.1 hypothetical protein ENSA7_78450 [Enhygromyxa salina]